MNWLAELFVGEGVMHSCIIIAAVSAVGIILGKVRIFGISLGISFVFFMGIVAGHFNMGLDPVVAEFAQSFGLCLFVFTLGLQVGPSFFSSLRSGGMTLNLLSIAVMILNIVLIVLISTFTTIPFNQMVGVMAGAVTNTPALGAAQQSLAQLGIASQQDITDMALACAVSYPLGVVSVIFVIAFFNNIFSPKVGITTGDAEDTTPAEKQPVISGVIITNKDFDGVEIKNFRALTSSKMIVSRVLRQGEEILALPETQIKLNDKLLITVSQANKERVLGILGEQCDIKWSTLDSDLVSRKIFVTKSEINGKTLAQLSIRKNYHVNITRVNRAGVFLIAENDLQIFIGDKLVLVGAEKDVKRVEKLVGNAIKKIEEPHLFTIFTGIVLGLIIGSVPIIIPGVSVPIKMGLAGGTIIVGILMGAFGYRFKFNTYTTNSANLMLREVGIIMYLSALGIVSGGGFVDSILNGNGLLWLMWSIVVSIVPILLVGFVAIKFMKKDLATILGMLCGSMANPPSLSYTTEVTAKNSPAVAYATVYPLTMFLRVVTAQILVMIFV